MSKEQLNKVLSMLSDLTCNELMQVREATYCKQHPVEITCPGCGKLTTVCGDIDEDRYTSGTTDLVIDDDNNIFYDWDHMTVSLGIDCYCSECCKYLGSVSDVEALWKGQQSGVGNVDDEMVVEISEEGYNEVWKQLGIE